MSKQVDDSTRVKSVKIPYATWRSVSHEAVERHVGFGKLIAIAWVYFASLPETRRERLVRASKGGEK